MQFSFGARRDLIWSAPLKVLLEDDLTIADTFKVVTYCFVND